MNMVIELTGIAAIALLAGLLGTLLGWASKVLKVEGDPRVDAVADLLPSGNCGQCGEAGCRQAAQAMVAGKLGPDCCPPGGRALAQSIAQLLGVLLAESKSDVLYVARIEESNCSGCGRCFKACPFDAIVGANRQMHTVIIAVCTGCQLCEKSCPQSCLSMVAMETNVSNWLWPKPSVA